MNWVTLAQEHVLRMRDSLKTDSKAREIFEYAFQNDKFEKGMELLPTVTNVYVMWAGEASKCKQFWQPWKAIFHRSTHQEILLIHPWNFCWLIETPNIIWCEISVIIRVIAIEL